MTPSYLKDEKFLQALNEVRVKESYLKITVLDFQEHPIREIQGQSLDGNIQINGSSAIRRTINLTMVASSDENDLTNIDNLISINKKVKIEIGTNNPLASYEHYGKIIWFPAGVYIIAQASVTINTKSSNIQITGRDKMCMLDGSCGGKLPASVTFHETGEIDETGKKIQPTIFQIVHECVRHFGGEIEQNIFILDLEEKAKLSIRYNGENPIWFPENYGGFIISEKTPTDYPAFLAHKFIYGQDIGYKETDMTFPGELVKGTGDSVVDVLNEIIRVLGNYEYFYDLEGHFIFQEKKNYLNHYYTPITKLNSNYYFQAFSDDKYYFSLINDPTVKSYNKRPQYEKIKNDFSIWGGRKNKNGGVTPIQYHLAIDKKPELDLATQYMGEIKTKAGEHLYYFFHIPSKEFLNKEERNAYEKELLEQYAYLSPEPEGDSRTYNFEYNDVFIKDLLNKIKETTESYDYKIEQAKNEKEKEELKKNKEEELDALNEQLSEYKIILQDTEKSADYQPLEMFEKFIVSNLNAYQFDIPYTIYCKITYNLTDFIYYKLIVQQNKIIDAQVIQRNRTTLKEIANDSLEIQKIKDFNSSLSKLKATINKSGDPNPPPPPKEEEGKDPEAKPITLAEENTPETDPKPETPKPEEPDPILFDKDLVLFNDIAIFLEEEFHMHFLTEDINKKIQDQENEKDKAYKELVSRISSLDKDKENVVIDADALYKQYLNKIEEIDKIIQNLIDGKDSSKIEEEKFKNWYAIPYTDWEKTYKPLFDVFKDKEENKENLIINWKAYLRTSQKLKEDPSWKEQQKLLIEYAEFLQSMLGKEAQVLNELGENKNITYTEVIPEEPNELFDYSNNSTFELIGRPCHEWREELYRQALLNQESSSEPGYYDVELLAKVVDTVAEEKKRKETEKLDGQLHPIKPKDTKTEMISIWRTIFDTLNKDWEDDWDLLFRDKQESPWDGWNPIVFTDPSVLTYWLDFIDNEELLSQFSVEQIGRRTYSETKDNIHYLYSLEIPDVIFFENTGNIHEMQGLIKDYEEIGQKYCAYKPIHRDYFVASSTGLTAFDYLRELVFNYLIYQSTVTISCSPKCYLEPNQLIYLKDEKNNLIGDYGITSITIPLKFDGSMTINLSEALQRV